MDHVLESGKYVFMLGGGVGYLVDVFREVFVRLHPAKFNRLRAAVTLQ